MSDVHASAAVALQTDFIKCVSIAFTVCQQLLEFFPLVSDNAATTETSYWNNHHLTSSIGLLLLAASTTSKLVLWLLTTRVVDEEAAVESKILVSEFFIDAFSATVVVNEATGNGGANGIGLPHDPSTVGGDGDVNLAQSVHGVGDNQRFHRLATGQGWLHDFNRFGVDSTRPFPAFTEARATAVFRFPEDSTDFFLRAITGHLPSIGEQVLPNLH